MFYRRVPVNFVVRQSFVYSGVSRVTHYITNWYQKWSNSQNCIKIQFVLLYNKLVPEVVESTTVKGNTFGNQYNKLVPEVVELTQIYQNPFLYDYITKRPNIWKQSSQWKCKGWLKLIETFLSANSFIGKKTRVWVE